MTTHNIKVIAAQRNSISDFLFSLGDFKFHMPTDLEKQLNITSSNNKGSCYGTMMTVYQENPFFSEMVRLKLFNTVGPVLIFTCILTKLLVTNLFDLCSDFKTCRINVFPHVQLGISVTYYDHET